jgi:hypothetical protein
MAEMCLSAYRARLAAAGYKQYPADVSNDWREDLVEIFSYAASKGTIKQNVVARHVIPRLLVLVPRTNEKKAQLVKDFAKHYEDVRNDMVAIDKIMGSGCKTDEYFIMEVREYLNGLHNALAKGEKWRNIISYTPLPLYRLLALCDLIKSSQPYRPLVDLITHIEDVHSWLNPQPEKFAFPTGLVDGVMKTLQEATEDKIAKTTTGPNAQQMAEYRAQKAESLRLQKEEQARQQESAHLETMQSLQAEKEKLKEQVKSLEMNAAKERAQESVRKSTEATATAQSEKTYQDQIANDATEISRLKTDLTNLTARQLEKKSDDTFAPSLPAMSGQLGTSFNSSFSSSQTANSSFSQPQSSLGTSFGSSMNGGSCVQPLLFGQALHYPTLKDDDAPMTDTRGFDVSTHHPTSFSLSDLSGPELRGTGQPNSFNTHIGNGGHSHLLGMSADDGNFKAACPAYKNGSCALGRTCKLPHTACNFWIQGSCRYGGKCNRSHDPFFLIEATSKGVSRRSPRDDPMVIDSVPVPRPSNFSHANPFSSHPPSTTGGSNPFGGKVMKNGQDLSSQTPPSGSRGIRSLADRITRNEKPTSNSSGASAQQPPPTGPRGSNFLIKGTTKQNQPVSSRSTTSALNMDDNNTSGQQLASSTSRGQNAFFDRITKNDHPISHQPQHTTMEMSLDNIIKASGTRKNNSQVMPPQSETLCRWQMTSPRGCTNADCGFKHDPPKAKSSKTGA